MARFNNRDIKARLSSLRSAIREGVVHLTFSKNPSVLWNVMYRTFDDKPWTVDNFNPQTLVRLNAFVDTMPVLNHGDHEHFPTSDEVATAIQNFINRRANPWVNVKTAERLAANNEMSV